MYIVYYELAMEGSREREKKGERVEVRAGPHPDEKTNNTLWPYVLQFPLQTKSSKRATMYKVEILRLRRKGEGLGD